MTFRKGLPEGFDRDELERRKRAKSVTPEEERKRCPYCGSITISPRTTGKPGPTSDHEWKCANDGCRRAFDDPKTGGKS